MHIELRFLMDFCSILPVVNQGFVEGKFNVLFAAEWHEGIYVFRRFLKSIPP
jgi:hypothetical protein